MSIVLLVALCAVTFACTSKKTTDELTVRGRLLASDGKPMKDAYVSLQGQGTRFRHTTDAKGRFSFAVDTTGGYWLWLTGVHHQTIVVPLLVDGPITLEARLRTAEYLPDIDSVGVIGEFNNFSPRKGAVPMTMRQDGTFEAVIETSADSLHYQLVGVQVDQQPIEGTQGDRYLFDWDRPLLGHRSGKYLSVVAARNGRATILFDPDALPRSDADVEMEFSDPGSIQTGVVAVWQDQENRRDRAHRAYRAHAADGKDPASFEFDWSADRPEMARQIDAESNDILRHFRLVLYFELGFSANDSLLARRVIHEVPPTSPVWSLVWGGPDNVFTLIRGVATAPRQAAAYANRAMTEHGDPDVRAAFLFDALGMAYEQQDSEASIVHYTRLMEEFPESPYAHLAKALYDADNQIKKGNVAPKFSLVSFDDSTVTYSPATFRGKVYLIDIWAVWCGPCLREMKYLHEAYETYKAKGFTILSVSLDREREDLVTFRKETWPMPWHHSWVAKERWTEIAQIFETAGIPKPILIDANGVILATDRELRGEKLAETLARAFE
jgi:thiol-disulfide isomerase/thioredoxin